MSNLLINPHYCPEDKDILDFVSGTGISTDQLFVFLKKRGVYASDKAKREDLAKIISREVYTWSDVQDLLGLLVTPVKRKNFITSRHQTSADFELLEEAAKKTNSFMLSKYGDKVSITASGPDTYRVTIDYTQTFYEKTRLIQRVEMESEIVIQKTSDGFKTRRSSDEKSHQIELAIIGEFEKLSPTHELITKKITLSSLPTLQSKVKFFTILMDSLNGYDFDEVKSVRVQSIQNDDVHDSDDEDETALEYASKIESLVINGRNLSGTDLYDSYVGKEFFITSATWVVRSDVNEYREAEVQASFIPVDADHELQFSTLGVRLLSLGELEPKTRPNAVANERFAELLRTAAEAALVEALK